WQDTLQVQTKKCRDKIKELQTEEKRLRIAADEYRTWNDKMEAVVKELDRCRREVGSLLARDITAQDDPLALLNDEAGKIERQLKKLAKAIKEKQGSLDQVEQELGKLHIIDDILHLEAKKEFIEHLKQSPEYEELEELLERTANLVEDLESIRVAISQ